MVETNDLLKYIEVPSAYQSKVIPKGNGVTFISNLNGIPEVWKSSLEGEPTLWGKYPDRVLDVYHSPDGERAIIGIDHKGDEKQQFFIQQNNCKEIEELVVKREYFHKFGGWSPNGQYISFSSNRRHPGYFDVFIQDVTTKEVKLVFEFDGLCEPICWTADGEGIVVSFDQTNIENDLYILTVETGALNRIGADAQLAHYSGIQFTKEGGQGYLLTNLGEETVYIGKFSIHQPAQIDKVFHVEKWDIEELHLAPDEKSLLFTVNEGGYSKLVIFDIETGTERYITNLPSGVIESLSWINDDQFIFTLKTATMAGDIWSYDIQKGISERLTAISHQEEIAEHWVEPSLRTFQSFDGLEIPYFLYSKGEEKNKPAIVYVHGGPESQIRPTYNPVIQYLAAKGFAVVTPNVRGSKGYGVSYIKLDDGRKRMDAVKDLTWLAKDLSTSLNIAQDRIGIIGRSYGGFMVLASLTHYPTYWKAGVNIVGISHFTSFLQNTGSWRRHLRECEYGTLAHDQAFFDDISPLNRAQNIQAPLLVFHGRNDTRVPVSEAEQLVAGMQERNQPVELIVFDDEGHQTERLENIITMHSETIRFFEKQLT